MTHAKSAGKTCIVFDFDGTLVDSLPQAIRLMQSMAPLYRFRRFDDSEVPRLRELGARQVLADLGIASWKVLPIAMHLRLMMWRDRHSVPLHAQAVTALNQLSHQFPVGIVTTNSSRTVRAKIPELMSRLQFVESPIGPFSKAQVFQRIQSVHDYDSYIYIGDEQRDCDACSVVGWPMVGVSWGYNSAQRLSSYCEEVVDDSEQLLQAVHTLAQHLRT